MTVGVKVCVCICPVYVWARKRRQVWQCVCLECVSVEKLQRQVWLCVLGRTAGKDSITVAPYRDHRHRLAERTRQTYTCHTVSPGDVAWPFASYSCCCVIILLCYISKYISLGLYLFSQCRAAVYNSWKFKAQTMTCDCNINTNTLFEPNGRDNEAVQYCNVHHIWLMTMLCKGFQTLCLWGWWETKTLTPAWTTVSSVYPLRAEQRSIHGRCCLWAALSKRKRSLKAPKAPLWFTSDV